VDDRTLTGAGQLNLRQSRFRLFDLGNDDHCTYIRRPSHVDD